MYIHTYICTYVICLNVFIENKNKTNNCISNLEHTCRVSICKAYANLPMQTNTGRHSDIIRRYILHMYEIIVKSSCRMVERVHRITKMSSFALGAEKLYGIYIHICKCVWMWWHGWLFVCRLLYLCGFCWREMVVVCWLEVAAMLKKENEQGKSNTK